MPKDSARVVAAIDKLSPRLRWALARLPIRPAQRVLEIGCGNGAALAQVASQLTSGHALGIDRSAKMAALGRRRLLAQGLSERAQVLTCDLATLQLQEEPFDLLFAMNVSLFARPQEAELARIELLLAPRGSLYVFYESPGWSAVEQFTVAAQRALTSRGFRVQSEAEQPFGVCVRARR